MQDLGCQKGRRLFNRQLCACFLCVQGYGLERNEWSQDKAVLVDDVTKQALAAMRLDHKDARPWFGGRGGALHNKRTRITQLVDEILVADDCCMVLVVSHANVMSICTCTSLLCSSTPYRWAAVSLLSYEFRVTACATALVVVQQYHGTEQLGSSCRVVSKFQVQPQEWWHKGEMGVRQAHTLV